jgi:hypothetical protein
MNQNRRKGGRPRKELGVKKDYRINTKMETKEYYLLLAKVKKAGTTISEFVRSAINNGYIKERLSVEQADHIRKLCGMANNLNQLAYQANVQGYSSIANRCILLADEIDTTIKLLKI